MKHLVMAKYNIGATEEGVDRLTGGTVSHLPPNSINFLPKIFSLPPPNVSQLPF